MKIVGFRRRSLHKRGDFELRLNAFSIEMTRHRMVESSKGLKVSTCPCAGPAIAWHPTDSSRAPKGSQKSDDQLRQAHAAPDKPHFKQERKEVNGRSTLKWLKLEIVELDLRSRLEAYHTWCQLFVSKHNMYIYHMCVNPFDSSLRVCLKEMPRGLCGITMAQWGLGLPVSTAFSS